MRKTKIVATLGPATSTHASIAALVEAGMDVARLNFSHGSYDEHEARIARVREAAISAGRPVAVLLDLQGPKIRTGSLVDHSPIELITGATLRIAAGDRPGDLSCIGTPYLELPHDVGAGDRILISDGRIELRVVSKSDREITTRVVHGGHLEERQGINLPGVAVSAPPMTSKDIADLDFGLRRGVDCIAMSFVRSAQDVLHVKQLVAKAGRTAPVIAKLERYEAIEALDEILAVADGVMVARGDMGVELSAERVPLIQKRIIRHANERGCPVITATQMLESMISSPRPTRAEASDVANAILDGTDALMLSGETAVGAFASEAVATMDRIAREIESGIDAAPCVSVPRSIDAIGPADAIGAAVASVVRTLAPVHAVCVLTQSGGSAQIVARHRPQVPILAFSPSEQVCRRLSLLWGVLPLQTQPTRDFDDLERQISVLALDTGRLHPGDLIVLTGSHPFDTAAPTNFLKLMRLETGH